MELILIMLKSNNYLNNSKKVLINLEKSQNQLTQKKFNHTGNRYHNINYVNSKNKITRNNNN